MADSQAVAFLERVKGDLERHIHAIRPFGVLNAELEPLGELRKAIDAEIDRVKAFVEPAPAVADPEIHQD